MCGNDINVSNWELTLGKLAIMWAVYVQPSHRGQGITMKLFKIAQEFGIGLNYDTITTYVLTGNIHGKRVAESFGVKPVLMEFNLPLKQGLKSPEAQAGLAKETT